MKRISLVLTCLLFVLGINCAKDEWIPIFDGQTMNGWTASENQDSWKIEDGALVTRGPRSPFLYG